MDKYIILRASDGMVLTNGKTYGKWIKLASPIDEYSYREITDAEYAQILKNQEALSL